MVEKLSSNPNCPAYSDIIADEICRRVAQGESLTPICKAVGISLSTFWDWRRDFGYLNVNYIHARDNQADAMDNKILDVIDRLEAKTLDPHSAKVMISAYQWRAERLKPKVYGAQSQITHISEQGPDKIARMNLEDLRALREELKMPVIEAQAVEVKE